MKVSYYNNVYDTSSTAEIDIYDFFFNVQSGKWQDDVLKYRAEEDAEKRITLKKKIPAITVSGYFIKSRKAANIEKHSGFLCMDIDDKDNEYISASLFESLKTDKYVYGFHRSVGGFGICIYFKINGSRHIDSFFAIERYLSNTYKLVCDQSCKDVSRLRFVSYDPDMFMNKSCEKWSEYIEKNKIQPKNFNPIHDNNDFEFIIGQIQESGIDLTSDYHDWIKIGMALAGEKGENGRTYFHIISQNNSGYDYEKADKKYTNLLKSTNRTIHISTFFWYAKNAGLQIKTQRTKKIESVARIRKKTVGKTGGATSIEAAKDSTIKYLSEVENIKDAETIIDNVFSATEQELNSSSDDGEIEQLTNYLKSFDIKHNEITGKIEYKKDDISDRIYNSIFLDAKNIFPEFKFSKEILLTIIDSDRFQSYNPFFEFIEKYKHLKPKGVIKQVVDCFVCDINPYYENAGLFIKKWLLSLIGSINGTYSLLILVLTGEQNTGKTKFFRGLLPDELKKYYAESQLDAGTDDEILMCQKLIIMDDEFGGKSKKEAKKLKNISSKQTFTNRKPYGKFWEDRNRIAVLCGTSNEDDIINDPTGNRRIIPIKVNEFKHEKFERINKIDLFIELYNEWKKTGDWWMLTKEEIKFLNNNTNEFKEVSIEDEMFVSTFINGNQFDTFYTTSDILNILESKTSKQKLSIRKLGLILKNSKTIDRSSKNGRYGYYLRRIDGVV